MSTMSEEAKHRRRILVADDDPAIRELSSTLLTQAGFDVATAEDGYSALDLLEEFHPEVFILDINMPAMDGFRVLEEMRKTGLTEQVKTLVLTARTNRDDVDHA